MDAITSLFWDVDPGSLDLDEHRSFIVGRVLEHGTLDQVRWLIGKVSLEGVRAALAEGAARWLSPNSLDLWAVVLGEPLDAGMYSW